MTFTTARVNVPYFTSEDDIQSAISDLFKGQREVRVDDGAGRIDVLTDHYIIECKKVLTTNIVNHAIGQLGFYHGFYPEKQKVIVGSKAKTPIAPSVLKYAEDNWVSIWYVEDMFDFYTPMVKPVVRPIPVVEKPVFEQPKFDVDSILSATEFKAELPSYKSFCSTVSRNTKLFSKSFGQWILILLVGGLCTPGEFMGVGIAFALMLASRFIDDPTSQSSINSIKKSESKLSVFHCALGILIAWGVFGLMNQNDPSLKGSQSLEGTQSSLVLNV